MKEILSSKKNILGVTFFLILPLLTFIGFENKLFLRADFLEGETSVIPRESDDFFIPDYTALPGQVGEVAVSVNTSVDSVVGFEMEIEYDEEKFSFEGFSTENTALHNQNFFIQENTNVPGVITIVGATGGSGTFFSKGDRVLFLTFRAGNESTEADISLVKLEAMKIIDSEMEKSEYTTATGKIFITAGEGESQDPYPQIQKVEPYRVVKNVTQKLTLFGKNLPLDFSAYAGSQELSVLSVNEDRSQAVLSLPKEILNGNYTVEIRWGESSDKQILTLSDGFIVEEADSNQLRVLSPKNYSSPKKIPNNGTTTTDLFVYIDDTEGIADLEKVTADLRVIGGDAGVGFQKHAIENGMQIWVLKNVTVPETVSTQTTPYKIPVVAQNKSDIHAEGTVSLWVSQDITSSIPPVIKSFTVSPDIIIPGDRDNPLLISAEVKDEDGGEDITTVAVDLSSVQMNTIFLTARNQGQQTSKTRFFESLDTIVIPDSVSDGEYTVALTVIDEQGEEAKSSTTFEVRRNSSRGPDMSNSDTYVTPATDLIRDGKFSFQIHTKVSDPTGADNIQSVSANLSSLGLPPVSLTGGNREGRAQWFSSESLILPSTAPIGKRVIELTATDKEGNRSYQDIAVTVGVKSYEGRPPSIVSDQNYITPPESLNDGETTFSAYVLVDDLDEDISHVILKLGNTALFAGKNLPQGTSSKDTNGQEKCVSTRTLLCMQPIMKESTGQWYYISDLVISKTTLPKDTPYQLEVLAVDQSGKTGKGYVNVPVKTKTTLLTDRENTISVVQPISSRKVQILFQNPLDPSVVSKDLFKISSAEDKNDFLGITDFSISPDGKVITLSTEVQQNKAYSVRIDSSALGIETVSVTDDVFVFQGYIIPEKKIAFKVIEIKSTSPNTFTLRFTHPINAQSIFNTGNIEILKKGSKDSLKVYSLDLYDSHTLSITTDEQIPGSEYNIFYKNILSAYGDIIDKKKSTSVKAYKAPLGTAFATLHGTADFNADGIVDFKDFTLFAAVYGKTYKQAEMGDINGDNTIDFSDFTLFSSQYGEILDASSGQGSKTESVFHGSAPSGSTNTNVGASQYQTQNITPTPLVYSAKPTPKKTPVPQVNISAPTSTPTVVKGSGGNTSVFDSSIDDSLPSGTPTPTPTPSISPSPTSTLMPTPTPTPSVSPSSTPTPSPSSSSTACSDPLACLLTE